MEYECPRCRGAGSHALIAGPGRSECVQCGGSGTVAYSPECVEKLARVLAVRAGRGAYDWWSWRGVAVDALQAMDGNR